MKSIDTEFPRVLVVSHNCFSDNTNMGRTLSSYFKSWNQDSVAQLYFHDETPNSKVCTRFYRFTDVDALKSIFLRAKKGREFYACNIEECRVDSRNYSPVTRNIYEFGRKRKPFVSYLRDLMWFFSSWYNRAFKKWLDNFDPQAVFIAAGDYAFPYKIAFKIAKQRNIPIYLCCYDDYFINYQHEGEFFRRVFYKHLLRNAKRTINACQVTFANNAKMAKDYEIFFGREWHVLYMPTTTICNKVDYNLNTRKEIAYFGNLSYKRNLQLVTVGRFLKELNSDYLPTHIDVYSNEKNETITDVLTSENGIVFHGSVSQIEVQQKMKNAIAVLHVESFDDQNRELVRYSFSTKIADCLGCGTPLIAFGPEDVASIEYLIDNGCAFVATKKDELVNVFRDILNQNKVNTVLDKAFLTVKNNHDPDRIDVMFENYFKNSSKFYNRNKEIE